MSSTSVLESSSSLLSSSRSYNSPLNLGSSSSGNWQSNTAPVKLDVSSILSTPLKPLGPTPTYQTGIVATVPVPIVRTATTTVAVPTVVPLSTLPPATAGVITATKTGDIVVATSAWTGWQIGVGFFILIIIVLLIVFGAQRIFPRKATVKNSAAMAHKERAKSKFKALEKLPDTPVVSITDTGISLTKPGPVSTGTLPPIINPTSGGFGGITVRAPPVTVSNNLSLNRQPVQLEEKRNV